MKTFKKAMLLALCALLLVSASVMGTLAYLKAQTGVVKNTFTVGNVAITLDEAKVDVYGNKLANDDTVWTEEKTLADRVTAAATATGAAVGNTYKLIPGHKYTKDPKVNVLPGSEACYIFVKVENGISAIEKDTTIAAQIAGNNWTALDGVDNVYYKKVEAVATDATKAAEYPVFSNFTVNDDAPVADYGTATIAITAYAVQADGFATAELAWSNTFGK